MKMTATQREWFARGLEAAARDCRRERIATAALAGLLSADGAGEVGYEKAAYWAIEHADALIAALDKPQDLGGAK
jgi:hypothetical protein